MDLKKVAYSVAAVAAMAVASSASAATVVNNFNLEPANSHFYLTSGSPTSSTITAALSNGFSGEVSFEDFYHFTIPQNGVGSGSLGTSYSSPDNKLTITDVIINGKSYLQDLVTIAGAGQTFAVSGIPITALQSNYIEVIGFTGPDGGSYGGNATFSASTGPVPEPESWMLMLGGVALVGVALRRRRAAAMNFA